MWSVPTRDLGHGTERAHTPAGGFGHPDWEGPPRRSRNVSVIQVHYGVGDGYGGLLATGPGDEYQYPHPVNSMGPDTPSGLDLQVVGEGGLENRYMTWSISELRWTSRSNGNIPSLPATRRKKRVYSKLTITRE